jgi:hypothetical protein
MAAGDIHEYRYTEPCGGIFFTMVPIYADWASISLQVDYGGTTKAFVDAGGQRILEKDGLAEGDSWSDETSLNNIYVEGALVGLDPVNATISNIVLKFREAAGPAFDWGGMMSMMMGMVMMVMLMGMLPKLLSSE